MAKKGSFSKVYDKNGDYVDVEAARFDGTRTFQMQGDVTASQTWNGDPSSPLTLNASIGAKKVTTDKINDKAVQAQQIDDGAVGLTQIATAAMNGTVQDNDSKLATHAAVKTYVDAQISGQGTYLGKHTVAEINAMVTDNLHNGDRVMTSDSGTINLGPGGVGFDVEAGEDLILYKSGSTVQWDSMDGNFKTKQTAVSDPTASGTGLTFIDSASQDENGEMTLSKKTVQDGTTSQKGVVQLEDSHSSTSTTKAATPNSVKEAYDLANTANTGAVKNVAYDSTNKKITKTINGTTSDVVSAATLKTDMALNNVDNTSDANKPVSTAQQAALDLKLDKTGDGKDVTATFTEASTRANIGTGEKLSVIFGKIKKWFTDLGTAAFKNVPASGNASSTEVVLGSDTRLSAGASAVQDVTVDGASVVNSSTKVAAVPNASTSAKGVVQLAGSIGATVASENNKAATEKAVRDAINALDAEVTSNDGTNVQVKVTEADGKISAVNVTTDNTENKNNKVSSWQTTPDNTHYPSEKLVKDGLDAKADADNAVTIYDSYVCRINTNGNYWYKIAEVPFKNGLQFRNAVWDVYANVNNSSGVYKGTLVMKTNSSSSSVSFKYARLYTDDWDSDVFDFKIVVNTTLSNGYVQLWAKLNNNISSLSISERFMFVGKYKPSKKSPFTYTSYDSVAGEIEPQTDAPNNITANPVDIVYRQHNIASPTNDNLVAMDANGLVKDSGLTKSSVESAITSAGSAIQGVKVNNTTLTPDANKVVTVPLATTSADGAMSAADKTKLNNAATYTQSSGAAPVKVDAYGALTPVPMDSTPTANSTNLMTSGDIKTALDSKADGYVSVTATDVSSLVSELLQYHTSVFGRFQNTSAYTKDSETLPVGFFNFVYIPIERAAGIQYATISLYPVSDVSYANPFIISIRGGSAYYFIKLPSSVQLDQKAPLASPALTGTPTAPTAASGTNTTQIATTAFVQSAVNNGKYGCGRMYSNYVNNAFLKIADIAPNGSTSETHVFFDVYVGLNSSSFELGELVVRIRKNGNDIQHNAKLYISSFSQVNIELKAFFDSSTNHVHIYGHSLSAGYMYIAVCPKMAQDLLGTLNLSNIVQLFSGNGTADEPTGVDEFDINVIHETYTSSSNGAVGSTSVPVYADANGELKACADDFVHDGDVAQTYSSSSTAPISGAGVGDAISSSYKYLGVLTSGDLNDKLDIGYYSLAGTFTNLPSSAPTTPVYGTLQNLYADGAAVSRTQILYLRNGTQQDFMWVRHYSNAPAWSPWRKVLRSDDVTSSYNPSGTSPINGTGVSLALATSLTDVDYAANASGGGGNLNKTKNGSTTSVLAFMTTAEARSVWTNAKAAVANAS